MASRHRHAPLSAAPGAAPAEASYPCQMERSAPVAVAHRARATRVAAASSLDQRPHAVRRDLVLLHRPSCSRTSICARSTSTTLEGRARSTRRWASERASWPLLLLSAVVFRLGTSRVADTLSSGIVALVLGLIAIVLQIVEYFTLGFGAASGGYASVFIGWTVLHALVALFGLYWIETQMASLWRARTRAGSTGPSGRGRAGRRHRASPSRDRGVLVLLGVLRRDRRARVHRPLRGLV